MVSYISTRGEKKLYTFSEAVLKGIASDGGLFIPTKIPHFSLEQLKTLENRSYQEHCLFIFKLFATDFSQKLLKKLIYQAYGKNFDNPRIAPLVKLKDNQYLLELWHGPTAAFKDIALQLMSLLFAHAIKSDNQIHHLILVATSGDTGKAALEGYRDKPGISILVFYPKQGVSPLQELQMVTQEGSNVTVVALEGNFDNVQRCIKETFTDKEFNKLLEEKYEVVLSSANSINWGRLLPQIVYYISSYVDLIQKRAINWGDKIDIAVPSGNFGNILAAFYAKKMGLPIRKLLCASNENNVW